MVIDNSASISLEGMTVGELREMLNAVPDDATIDIHTRAGDRPWESSTNTMKVSWKSII